MTHPYRVVRPCVFASFDACVQMRPLRLMRPYLTAAWRQPPRALRRASREISSNDLASLKRLVYSVASIQEPARSGQHVD